MSPRGLLAFLLVLAAIPLSCSKPDPETITFRDGEYEILMPGGRTLRTDLDDAAELQMGQPLQEASAPS